MESSSGLQNQHIFRTSPLVKLNGRNPTGRGRATPDLVKLVEGVSRKKYLPMHLCSATSYGGGFRQQQGGRLVGNGDGVIIVDHGSRRKESNLMLDEFVKMFKEKMKYPIVEPAHMELAKPSIEDAFSLCVQKGAKRIIVSPFFLSPGRHWTQDIPSLAAAAAKEHPGVSYLVTAPLGLHELLVDVMNDRITHCLSHVSGDAEECSVCAGTRKCQLYG
ncbi:OLC1v1011718C1 [Oldenlandia corymbosa var. corymbosa]|uniref:OLC1v1011718C1 n=1 Tax=Oldenlandia corymbosa var. corymbosa TaxID=529605 RepID=A0AAV1DUH2_OLDCO|nr:OLC1v1011718C1 [Oldenlandia corymbosa var. corymbosa]